MLSRLERRNKQREIQQQQQQRVCGRLLEERLKSPPPQLPPLAPSPSHCTAARPPSSLHDEPVLDAHRTVSAARRRAARGTAAPEDLTRNRCLQPRLNQPRVVPAAPRPCRRPPGLRTRRPRSGGHRRGVAAKEEALHAPLRVGGARGPRRGDGGVLRRRERENRHLRLLLLLRPVGCGAAAARRRLPEQLGAAAARLWRGVAGEEAGGARPRRGMRVATRSVHKREHRRRRRRRWRRRRRRRLLLLPPARNVPSSPPVADRRTQRRHRRRHHRKRRGAQDLTRRDGCTRGPRRRHRCRRRVGADAAAAGADQPRDVLRIGDVLRQLRRACGRGSRSCRVRVRGG